MTSDTLENSSIIVSTGIEKEITHLQTPCRGIAKYWYTFIIASSSDRVAVGRSRLSISSTKATSIGVYKLIADMQNQHQYFQLPFFLKYFINLSFCSWRITSEEAFPFINIDIVTMV